MDTNEHECTPLVLSRLLARNPSARRLRLARSVEFYNGHQPRFMLYPNHAAGGNRKDRYVDAEPLASQSLGSFNSRPAPTKRVQHNMTIVTRGLYDALQ